MTTETKFATLLRDKRNNPHNSSQRSTSTMKARIENIILKVLPSDHLDDSAHQALELSIKHKAPVLFMHSGKVFRVKYVDLLDQIKPDHSLSWSAAHGN